MRRAALTIVALLLLGACSSGAPAPSSAAAAGADAGTTVSMAKSYVFEPADITVEPGATVTWVNEDNFTHTVRIGDEVIGQAAPGESITHDFAEAGTFAYDCSLHPQDMRGVVNVGA